MEGDFIIKSNDDKEFTVSQKAAMLSDKLQNIKDNKQAIPTKFDSKTIEKLIEYLNHFQDSTPVEIQKPIIINDMKKITDEWSADFVDKLTIEELVNLTEASNTFIIESLLNLCCAKLVTLCKGKTEEEIFKTFGIPPNEFTDEQRKKIYQENNWIDNMFK